MEDARIQYAAWSPGSVLEIVSVLNNTESCVPSKISWRSFENSIYFPLQAFVAGFTIYKHDVGTATTANITAHGMEKVVIYGIPDWVYEGIVVSTV